MPGQALGGSLRNRVWFWAAWINASGHETERRRATRGAHAAAKGWWRDSTWQFSLYASEQNFGGC